MVISISPNKLLALHWYLLQCAALVELLNEN